MQCTLRMTKNDTTDDKKFYNSQTWSSREHCLEQCLIFKFITAQGGPLKPQYGALGAKEALSVTLKNAVLHLMNSLIHI